MQLHFMGGGARIVEAVGEYNRERTHFNHDICETAKGYEHYCYMILRESQMSMQAWSFGSLLAEIKSAARKRVQE